MASNPVVNSLSFSGNVAGQATIQAQGIAGGLTFLLPNLVPIQGQLLDVQSVNGNNVFLGFVSPQSSSFSLSQLLASGATNGQTIIFNGTNWVPSTGLPGEGTVTSVAATVPAELSIAGSPITSSGTLAFSWASGTGSGGQGKVIATPAGGGAGAYAGRVLVAGDIPALPYDASGAAATAQSNAEAFTTSALTNYAQLAGATFTGSVSLVNVALTAIVRDGAASAGTSGQLLSSTVTGVAWLSQSSLAIAGSQVTGNITGNAASITGSIAESQVTNLVSDLAAKAPLASPTFTGTVTTAAISATSVSASSFVAVTGNLDLSSGHGHIVQNTDIAGTITVNTGAPSGSYSILGTYASAPIVVASPTSDPAAVGATSWWVSSTTSAITINVTGTTSGPLVFNYIAMGN